MKRYECVLNFDAFQFILVLIILRKSENFDFDFQECFLHLLNEGRVEDVSVSPIPDDPVPSDGSDSESEDEATSSDVFLSTKNKIHLLLLLGTKRRYNLSYTATEAVMQLAGVLADEESYPKLLSVSI